MKLGLAIGYSGANLRLPIERIIRAEKLGYDSVWSAEAYGSDAIGPLAFIAAQTKRNRLGSGVMQLAARTPANAAMCAATVDALAGGNRFIAGLGLPGDSESESFPVAPPAHVDRSAHRDGRDRLFLSTCEIQLLNALGASGKPCRLIHLGFHPGEGRTSQVERKRRSRPSR